MNYRICCCALVLDLLLIGCSDPAGPGLDDSGTAQTVGTEPGSTAPTTTGGTGDASQSNSGSASGSASDSVGSGSGGGTGECESPGGPAPVELGDADVLGAPGAYVMLAKAAITNVPGSEIAGGHIGVSPAAASAITGFSLALDPTGVYASSPELAAPARVYAADYVVPTPIDLTTAVLGMQAAYADAASRPTDHLDLESGDIGGLTLAPGVYTWGSTVLVADDVTLAGCEDDVWILQISGDLDISTGKRVLLAGDAQARNVFWQIAGGATIRAAAHIEGVVLAKTEITLQTGASMHGRAFAQTMIALDANAVTAP